MKFIHRLAYYLGGFSVGLIILFFILNKKEASCDYTPEARVKKNIGIKPKVFSEEAEVFLLQKNIDTTTVFDLIKFGDINFKESKTKEETCNEYSIYGTYADERYHLIVANCPDTAKIKSLSRVE
ncbi:MAG TPA: DUF4258 domain-containing protein [Flavobacteriaceae bacterium]|nr:DUF4258 domain-containing protein [Flavobacteriaceae bacterium]